MKGLYTYGAADISDIVSAPLEAILKADIGLSEKITEFIAWYGFEPVQGNAGNDMGNLKLVSFSYLTKDGETATISGHMGSIIAHLFSFGSKMLCLGPTA